jgi:UDP-N-acetyl-D-glucosamine dehydrogenase
MTAARTLSEWLQRVDEPRQARIGVIGLGYVGLPLTLLLCEDRFRVLGLDIDEGKVATLNGGGSYIHRIEPEAICAAQAAGFRATSDFSEVSALDAILICVPTPLYPDHRPDMRAVVATMDAIAPHLCAGQLVVLESTTYPGTTEEIVAATIERCGNVVLRGTTGQPDEVLAGVMVAFSPEREDPGNTTTPRREIPKVVGGIDACATAAACALYDVLFRRTIAMSTPAAAEMTKLLENIYRSVNIALVNELKQLCLAMKIDVWEVIGAASTKPFGFQPFQPGPGVGGHCIPVDPFYLTWKATQHGFRTRFVELAGEVNESMPAYIVETTIAALGRNGVAIAGAKVLVLGVAYKRDVDDLRESPALTILSLLRAAGAEIAYNDPYFPRVGSGRHYDLRMESTPLNDLARFDCVLLVTDHSAYDTLAIATEARLLIDTRNATAALLASDPALAKKIVRC